MEEVGATERRTKAQIYDDLLRFQCELSFDLESAFFRLSPSWSTAVSVLDFGAGNSYYTAQLAHIYPEKRFVALERDSAVAATGERWTGSQRIQIVAGSYESLSRDAQFDFVVARHVLSYLDDRSAFYEWLSKHTTHNAGILVIDADDSAFVTQPRLPLLERGNDEFKERVAAGGGDRSAAEQSIASLGERGFSHLWTRPLAVHSDIQDRKYLMFMFMLAVAEYDHGSPLPLDVRQELDRWSRDSRSFLQYGLMASSFQRVPQEGTA